MGDLEVEAAWVVVVAVICLEAEAAWIEVLVVHQEAVVDQLDEEVTWDVVEEVLPQEDLHQVVQDMKEDKCLPAEEWLQEVVEILAVAEVNHLEVEEVVLPKDTLNGPLQW